MKRWLSTCAAVLALSIAVPAIVSGGSVLAAPAQAKAQKGQAKGKGKGPVARIQNVMPQLNLTAEQKPKVDEALKAASDQIAKAHEGVTDPKEKAKVSRPIMKSLREKLNGILTPDQQSKLKELTAPKKKAAK